MPATITSIAHYVPSDVYPNSYFSQYLDTTDEWIVERTGIKERRFAKDGATSDLIVPAALECLQKRGMSPDDVDCIIVTTVTPDHFFPSTACVVQDKIGAKNAWGFDMSAACSGFVFGLVNAAKLVESGVVRNVLLCSGEKMSTITDFSDRRQCVIFGDGAGCVLIEKSEEPGYGIIDQVLHIDGSGAKYLHMVAGGSFKPASDETVKNKEHYIVQDGQNVFKAAVKSMADVACEVMKRNNLTNDTIDWFVPHQANLRIIDFTGKKMKLDPAKVMINIEKYGNTTSATIPICLSEWHKDGKLKKGQNVILASFGGGFTWGAIYLRWSID
ncbi:MAG: beta-ketoacyl-ACP synthase III [bacterium]